MAYHSIEAAALLQMNTMDMSLLDVRTHMEYRLGTVPGAVNVPFDFEADEFGENGELTCEDAWRQLEALPKGQPLYVFCTYGPRSEAACEQLAAAGWDAVDVQGGYRAWQMARFANQVEA